MASLKPELKLQSALRNISVGAQMERVFAINTRTHVLLRTQLWWEKKSPPPLFHWPNVLKHESNLWSHPERGAHRGVPTETSAGQLSRHTWKNEGKILSVTAVSLQDSPSEWCHPHVVMLWLPLQVNLKYIFPVLWEERPSPQRFAALQLRLSASFVYSDFSRTRI